ncbi:hypothetical protein RchiOBHm_Chr1g0348811 [Rosa chinensis]|uniref:Uncharacterized protein n=1 Tax=Rosa chinensis TaxID=74649 RepID=A0A2P6SFM4_ROSCH|nr:hypothetical protein RchiOBHm_Chr1g0348811 [Rosa chinensis]
MLIYLYSKGTNFAIFFSNNFFMFVCSGVIFGIDIDDSEVGILNSYLLYIS